MSKKCWHEAPFDKLGNQCSFPDWRAEMRPVEAFDDTLAFVGFRRGRSAANGIWRRTTGGEVVMFLKDMESVMPKVCTGSVKGRWVYVKRGENYGVAHE